MSPLSDAIKQRRLALNLKQHDMLTRIGLSRQQYQRLEAKGNPRLDTLELIAAGLNSQVMLIPIEKRHAVLALLNDEKDETGISDNPWSGLLDGLDS